MKSINIIALLICLVFMLTACGLKPDADDIEATPTETQPTESVTVDDGVADIELSDTDISIEASASDAVYVANDIVYYEDGKDFTYGEGSEQDAHSKDDAEAHSVVHITKAGTYRLSGKLSKGQVAVDLGKDAKESPEAVVTLILDGVDITCEVAPAVIFYNVYECSDDDTETASKDADTSKAGANVIIADGSENVVNGSYVARIYKPESVVLSSDGIYVEDASKLHKYDGAFYSRMSMNINGGEEGTGVLTINAENEGLDSELHLTINGGIININSGNDGINTNEDEVSVTTVNGGVINIRVTGETGEGDGIDSNGWLVINGGEVRAQACSASADAGIDSDMGIHINGGTVIASGSMLDRIEEGGQECVVFNLGQRLSAADGLSVKNSSDEVVATFSLENTGSVIVYSSPRLTDDTYTLCRGDEVLAEGSDGMTGGHGGPGAPPPERY